MSPSRQWFEGVKERSVFHASDKSQNVHDNLQLRDEKLKSCLQKLDRIDELLNEVRVEAQGALYAGLIYRLDGVFRKLRVIRAFINHKRDNIKRHLNG